MSNLDPKKVWSYNERVWACASVAELEAEKCVLIDQQREAKNILIDKNFHIDSLYEKGYKLQQRIAELEEKQRWIPVSERLPEDGETVFVIIHDGFERFENGNEVARLTYLGNGNWWSWESERYVVTHWMPLPESPIVYGKVCIDQLAAHDAIERQDDKWIPEVQE